MKLMNAVRSNSNMVMNSRFTGGNALISFLYPTDSFYFVLQPPKNKIKTYICSKNVLVLDSDASAVIKI